MSSVSDPRHVARALAMQQLFAQLVAKQQMYPLEDVLAELEVDTYDQELLTQIVEGTSKNIELIDNAIQKLAPAWPLSQIAPVDLTLLRTGIWEAFVGQITPAKVVINECIELAKQFGGPNSSAFINGVLGNLVNSPDLQKSLLNVENVITPDAEEIIELEVPIVSQ